LWIENLMPSTPVSFGQRDSHRILRRFRIHDETLGARGLRRRKVANGGFRTAAGAEVQSRYSLKPFLVVTGGEWTEGAPGIERVHTALVAPTLTIGPRTSWFFNRTETPATALIIEFMPSADLDVGG
jgi:hypothetical protein